jgi:hypothetical protein
MDSLVVLRRRPERCGVKASHVPQRHTAPAFAGVQRGSYQSSMLLTHQHVVIPAKAGIHEHGVPGRNAQVLAIFWSCNVHGSPPSRE